MKLELIDGMKAAYDLYMKKLGQNIRKGKNATEQQILSLQEALSETPIKVFKKLPLVEDVGGEEFTQSQYELALKIAVDAHFGARDKGSKAYILHPLYVANQLMYDLELATIAILHDVIEDTWYVNDDFINMGFSPRVIDALEKLTHKKGVSYEDYIEEVCTSFDAIKVKRKDIEHNTDVKRLKGLRQKDFERTAKYHRAYVRLGEAKKTFHQLSELSIREA